MGNGRFNFSKGIRIPVIVIGIVVALSIGTAAYFLLSGKTARESFLNAESKNFKKYSDQIKKTYGSINEARKPYLTGSYKIRTELTADINPGAATSESMDSVGIYDIIKKFKLIIDSTCNPVEKTGMTQLSILLEKTPFIDAQIYSKEHGLYFTVPVLTPGRYFSINTDKLDEVYDRFNIPVRPKKLTGLLDPAGVIYFNNQEFDNVATGYGKEISKAIAEKDVKYGKNVEVNISGEKVKGREIFVTPGEESSNALLRSITRKAGADDILLKLTYGNFSALAGALGDAGIFQLFDYLDKTGAMVLNDTERGFLKAISSYNDLQGFKKVLEGAMDNYMADGGIWLRLVVDRQENILEQQLTVKLKNKVDNSRYDIEIKTGTNSLKCNDYRNRSIDAAVTGTSAQGAKSRYYFKINPALEPTGNADDSRGKVEVSFGLDRDGIVQSGISATFELDSSVDKLTLKKNSIVKYTLDLQSAGTTGTNSLKGDIATTSWKNNKLKTKNSTTTLTINADLPSFGITGYSVKINLAREDKFGLEPFKLPEIPQNSVVNLNTVSDDELGKVESDILASFGTFYLTNKPIVDAVLGNK